MIVGIFINQERPNMAETRTGSVTLKGNPVTLAGNELQVGQAAPDFKLQDNGLQEVTLASSAGKTRVIAAIPSLDTPVCQIQTKKFNEELSALGDKVNALTVSLDLPFAMNRFCGAEKITNIRCASDYQNRSFGQN